MGKQTQKTKTGRIAIFSFITEECPCLVAFMYEICAGAQNRHTTNIINIFGPDDHLHTNTHVAGQIFINLS